MLSRVSSDRISFCSSKARVSLLWDSSVLSAPAYKSDSNGFIKFKFWPPLNGAKAFKINYFVTSSFQFRLQIVKSLCRIKREYQTRTAALQNSAFFFFPCAPGGSAYAFLPEFQRYESFCHFCRINCKMKITKQGVKVIFFDSMNLKKARVSFFRSGLKVSKADRVPKTVIARQLQLSRSLEKAQLFHEHICI